MSEFLHQLLHFVRHAQTLDPFAVASMVEREIYADVLP